MNKASILDLNLLKLALKEFNFTCICYYLLFLIPSDFMMFSENCSLLVIHNYQTADYTFRQLTHTYYMDRINFILSYRRFFSYFVVFLIAKLYFWFVNPAYFSDFCCEYYGSIIGLYMYNSRLC